VGGALVVADAGLGDELAYHQNAMGAVSGPFDSWLTLRGVRTLGVRVERHCDNAERIVEYLARHRKVASVLYPGLPEHPNHEVAAKQMRRFGGMVSFRVAGGAEAAIEVCNRSRLFILAESLGGVESLIEHPGRMTHASAAGSPLEVPDDLVRLSVGIESADDLLSDLEQALA
jgi:cystathionine gamma-synthase